MTVSRRSEASRNTGETRVHVALLRGINVGGKNKVPMKDLAAMFVAAGCRNVTTHIQSGNVVYTAGAGLARTLAEGVSEAIRDRFGYNIPVVTRTAAELQKAVADNPFLKAGADTNLLHVAFLAGVPGADDVATLDHHRSPPDAFAVSGREVYLLLPHGVARSKLTNAYFDARLGTVSTIRNWRTVLALAALADG